jgi:hypothetical protein
MALRNVRVKQPQSDFTFIVGSHRHRCPSVAAEFLSPRVCEIRAIDATINELSLGVDDKGGLFGQLILLSQGETVEMNCSVIERLLLIYRQLRNFDLSRFLESKIREPIKADNAIDQLVLHSQTLSDGSSELDYVSSHFCEFANRMNEFNVSMTCEIISRRSLKIESEDWLYDYIMNSQSNDSDRWALLEFVQCEYLSATRMSDFLEFISERLDAVNICLFRHLQVRLHCPVTIERRVNAKEPMQFDLSRGHLDGIIAFLSRKCGGNVHDKGIVNVTCSGILNDDSWFCAKNAADLKAGSAFASSFRRKSEQIEHAPNNWICYDFKKSQVIPTHYSIRSYYVGGWNNCNLKSWVIEASMDGRNWTRIDHKENNFDLNGANVTRAYEVSNKELCRYVRLVNIGRNHSGSDSIWISSFEIFGSLIEAD